MAARSRGADACRLRARPAWSRSSGCTPPQKSADPGAAAPSWAASSQRLPAWATARSPWSQGRGSPRRSPSTSPPATSAGPTSGSGSTFLKPSACPSRWPDPVARTGRPATETALRDRPLQMQALNQAALALPGDLHPDSLLYPLLRTATKLAGARYGALGVPDGPGGFDNVLTVGI